MLSGFFEGNDGCWYPADRIRWIGRRPSEQGIKPTALGHTTPVNVHMQDEGAVQIHERRVDELLRQPVHVWPALPGCFVIHIWDEEEEIGAGKTAIIAWCIARDGRVYPITVSGVNDDLDQDLMVMTPDGEVTAPCDQAWPTLDALISERRAAANNKRALKAIADGEKASEND